MLRIKLNEAERARLAALRRDRTLRPAERSRVEMVALSDSGFGVPAIAQQLGVNPETVRRLFHRWDKERWGVVRLRLPGPPPDTARREKVEAALRERLVQARTWTARQLAEDLSANDVLISEDRTRFYLKQMGARWRRTKFVLDHQQDPKAVAQAEKDLDALKNGLKQAS